jgi:hypothetical protein
MPNPTLNRGTLIWSATADGAEEFSVAAVRMPMAAFVSVIVGIVVVLGAVATAVLIQLDESGVGSGRWLAILVGGGFGIAASIALLVTLRLSRRLWQVRVEDELITLRSATVSRKFPLAKLKLVKLRRHTDYARLVIVGSAGRLTLLAGMGLAADPRDTTAAYLPEFSATVRARLTRAGLTERRSPKDPNLVSWVRN